MTLTIPLTCILFLYICKALTTRQKKVREKSREWQNHKPQPFPDTKRERKPTNPNQHKSNKRTKSNKISSLFPKQGNRNAKRTEKHKNKMKQGKTKNKSSRRNTHTHKNTKKKKKKKKTHKKNKQTTKHKATKSKTKTNTETTALERSVEQTLPPGSLLCHQFLLYKPFNLELDREGRVRTVRMSMSAFPRVSFFFVLLRCKYCTS